jgi:hypothetical protein
MEDQQAGREPSAALNCAKKSGIDRNRTIGGVCASKAGVAKIDVSRYFVIVTIKFCERLW